MQRVTRIADSLCNGKDLIVWHWFPFSAQKTFYPKTSMLTGTKITFRFLLLVFTLAACLPMPSAIESEEPAMKKAQLDVREKADVGVDDVVETFNRPYSQHFKEVLAMLKRGKDAARKGWYVKFLPSADEELNHEMLEHVEDPYQNLIKKAKQGYAAKTDTIQTNQFLEKLKQRLIARKEDLDNGNRSGPEWPDEETVSRDQERQDRLKRFEKENFKKQAKVYGDRIKEVEKLIPPKQLGDLVHSFVLTLNPEPEANQILQEKVKKALGHIDSIAQMIGERLVDVLAERLDNRYDFDDPIHEERKQLLPFLGYSVDDLAGRALSIAVAEWNAENMRLKLKRYLERNVPEMDDGERDGPKMEPEFKKMFRTSLKPRQEYQEGANKIWEKKSPDPIPLELKLQIDIIVEKMIRPRIPQFVQRAIMP